MGKAPVKQVIEQHPPGDPDAGPVFVEYASPPCDVNLNLLGLILFHFVMVIGRWHAW
jgi:hypothetical protein